MIPFLVADRPASLRILAGLAVPPLPHRIGLMTHANTSTEFTKLFSLFPCGEPRYCEAIHPTTQHGQGRCEFGVAFSRRFVKMGDSGVFSKDGCRQSDYSSLFKKYRRLGVRYGIMIDHLKDAERTLESAGRALEYYQRGPQPFHLIGVAQGNTLRQYLDCYSKLRRMGFSEIAVGGLLKKKENSKRFAYIRDESALYGVLRGLRVRHPNDWLFALGAYHPKRHNRFDALNVFGGDYKGWIFQYSYDGRKKARAWRDEERYGQVRRYIEEQVFARMTGAKSNRNLLVLGCSRSKRRTDSPLPAIERYDGPGFRMVRKMFFDGLHFDVDLMIFSAKFGILWPSALIPYYDYHLGEGNNSSVNRRASKELRENIKRLGYREVFLSMGQRYAAALECFSKDAEGTRLIVPRGRIGERMHQTRRWLIGKSNRSPPR